MPSLVIPTVRAITSKSCALATFPRTNNGQSAKGKYYTSVLFSLFDLKGAFGVFGILTEAREEQTFHFNRFL